MGLTARERRVLASMETGLAASDPDLAGALGMFARLALTEEMPRHDVFHRGVRPCHRRGMAALVGWLVVSIMLITSGVILGRGAGTCTPSGTATCAVHVLHTRY